MIHRSKYRNIKTVVDNIRFDSQKEARYYGDLKIRRAAGVIAAFERQVSYPLVVNGAKCGTYRADFVEYSPDGKRTVVDVKGFKTPVYRLKKKLVKAIYGIDIVEV